MATESDGEHVWTIPADLRLQLLSALSAKTCDSLMSFEEFLAWSDEDTRAEWVHGEVVMPSPASVRHQQIVQLLLRVLASFLEIKPLGTVLVAPFLMKLENAAREPDLLFIATDHLDRLTSTYLNGPADLVVEVILPESIGRDRGEKFYEYQAAGIPEYWLIDPLTNRAEFYQLDSAGQYQLVSPDASGVYHSKVLPGFWLRATWLWQDPLPTANNVLRELGVIG